MSDAEDLRMLPGTLRAVWQRLETGARDRTAPARHPVLATTGPDGPALRLVVLRDADRALSRLEVHTDARSEKIAHLARDPRAELLVWDASAQLQIRLRARAEILQGPEAAASFARIPAHALRAYGGHPAPGTVIPDPADHDATGDPAHHFRVLALWLDRIETLHLARDRHRRARFGAQGDWRGAWLAP